MKIFIICTVRNATEEYLKNLYDYVAKLEAEGHEVHLPPRDTNQEDNETGGYRICFDNFEAIKWADEIHISYNPASTGTHFDLGMAFALNKKIKVFENLSSEQINGKSFQNMMKYWENVCDLCSNGRKYVFEAYNESSGRIYDECPKCGVKSLK